MTDSTIIAMPALVGYMGQPTSQPRARLGLPANIEYTVTAMTPGDADSFVPRKLAIADALPFLDGVQATHVNQAGPCGKILAKFGDAGDEVAIQLTSPLGGVGVLRHANGEVTAVSASSTVSVQVDVQKADRTYVDNWATLTLATASDGSTTAQLLFPQAPDTPIGVAMVSDVPIDGGGSGLGFYFWTGESLPFNGGYLEGKLVWDGSLSFTGAAFLEQGGEGSGPTLGANVQYVKVAARGTYLTSATHKALLGSVRARQGAPSLGSISVADDEALWRQIKDIPMSVAELVGIPNPDPTQYHKAVQRALVACALNAAPQSWLTALKLNKRAVPPQVQSIADDPNNKDFFLRYVTAMGSSEVAVSQLNQYWKVPGGYSTAFKRMQFYWQGNTTGTLAFDKDFLRVNQAIAVTQFASVVPQFQRYMALTDPDKLSWAQKLLAAITTPDQLRSICATSDARDIVIHKYVTMLSALAPKSGLRQTFEAAVNAQLVKEVNKRMGALDEKSAQEFILLVLQQLVAPTPQDTSELFTVLQTELNELKVKDPNAYAMLVGSLAGSAATLASIAGTNRAWAAKVQQWNSYVSGLDIHNETQSRIYKAYGILALTMVNIGMSTYAFVESVESWSDLRPDQKVASVASAFQTLMSVREGFNLIKYIRNPDLNIGNAIRIGDVDFLALNDDPAYAIQQTQTLAERGCATVVRDTLKAFLEPVNAIIAVIGVINIVTVGFQIAEDVDDGQPVAVIVMDAVTELTLAVAVATTPFVAACPAIGVVVAIAGIIEAIVGIFIPRNPPPIVQWTQDTASTFVAAIPDPSAGWLSQYHIAVPTALLATDLAADLTVAPVDAGDGNLVAQIIWQAIEGIRSLPDLSANLEALVQNAPGVGPVFFRTPGNGTVVNGTDHTKSITEVGAWTMGYLIAGNSNFSVVNQAAAAQSLSGFFTGSAAIAFSEDVFLEWLYETRGFAAVAQYQKTAAGKEIVEKILAPLFIPLSWAQEEDHLLPLQILMLLATNWGADLTEVRQRYATAGLPETVFAYADHTYNFFSSLAANNDYISTISASQTLQHGSPGSNCGVDSCNLCSPTTCQWGGGPYNWSYVRLFHGDAVWNWVVGNPSLVPVTGERPFTIVRISIGPDKAPPAGRRYPPPCPC